MDDSIKQVINFKKKYLQMTKRAPCPPRGQDLPSSRSKVTARDKELAQEFPLLVDCVNLDKSLSFSELPFPHM